MNPNITRIQLRCLITLAAVGRERSFSRAAQLLNHTQSAVSQQIRRLEEDIGQQLVERPGGSKPVTLTPAGELLMRHGEAIVARLESAVADMQALSRGEVGELAIGYYQSLGAQFLPRVLKRFLADWPQVKVRLVEAENDATLLHGVEHGELDLAFFVYPLIAGPFAHSRLFDDPYVMVTREDDTLGKNGVVQPGDLAGVPIITYGAMRPVHYIENQLHMPQLKRQIVLRSNNNKTILGFVSAGIGVALISKLSAEPVPEGLRCLPLADTTPRSIGIAWHYDRYQLPAASALVRIVQQQATAT